MNNRLTIPLIGLIFLMAAVPVLRGSETGPEALIIRARAVVLSPHFSGEAITQALVDVLDASLHILPKTGYAEEYRSRIEGVKKTLGEASLFAEKAYQELGLAYRLVTGGKAWQLPEELKSPDPKKGIEQATKRCVQLLDSALAEYKAGRSEQAVSHLINFVLLVVTPIEAER